MTDEQRLIAEGLRDIHMPSSIGMWPPAPGWWMLAITLLVALCYSARWYIQYRHQRNPQVQAAKALTAAYLDWQEHNDDKAYLQYSHRVLRQLAISLAGRNQVSRLHGKCWVDWLENRVLQPFPDFARYALVHAAYHPQGVGNEQIEQLHAAYLRWIALSRSAKYRSGTSLFQLPKEKESHA